ncbi:MAG: hypothetical protein HFF52_02420 [Lawsonibacter sp.]|nr:hypothetical protein [Lawsonibacter sp.]
MDDLMKCLYQFMLEHRMGSLRDDREYCELSLNVELQTERVRGYLTGEQRKELNRLIDATSRQNSMVIDHAFQAALALSKELNTLVRA